MKINIIFFILFFSTAFILPAQNFERELSIAVTIDGSQLENPWSGGMDAPEYSTIDMNGDNIKDLLVFDRLTNRISTFLNNGTPGQIDYHFAPQYISAFPIMRAWMQLVDFNCDGKEDIFTDVSGGIMVYLNVSVNSLQFTLFDSLLHSQYGPVYANLFCNSQGHSCFTDIDSDGDLDILASSITGLEYHKNQSVELYGTCDSLIFILDPQPWGGVYFQGGGQESRNYLATDMDSDGDKDLLTNNISNLTNSDFGYIKHFENIGDTAIANLVLVEDSFPNTNDAAHIRDFAGVFAFDADNDSKTDLIISPQMNSTHNVNNSWFLKDTSSTSIKSFENIMDNFLCNGMIDVGIVANVRFSDIDSDGLTDIIIGNLYRQPENGNDSSSIYYFRNNGTTVAPSFELVTNNFANSMTTSYSGYAPAFGDLDGDLDNDMITGKNDGTLSLFINNSGVFNFNSGNYQGIDVGMSNAPFLFDVNQDGLIDLICGNKTGRLQYFQNTGTLSSPVFTLINTFFGEVDVVEVNGFSPFGYSYPVMYLRNGALELLVGSEKGTIFIYGNISGNLPGTFTLIDSMYGGINETRRVTVDVADINGDALPDIIAGNYDGGAAIYKQLPVSLNESMNVASTITISPNPATTSITVHGLLNNEIQIINFLGKIVLEKIIDKNGTVEINVSELSSGIYFVKSGHSCCKFAISD